MRVQLKFLQAINLDIEQMEDLLLQLRYRQDYHLASKGTYYKKGSQVYLKTRDFNFWDKQQQSEQIRVSFGDGEAVTQVIDLAYVTRNPHFPNGSGSNRQFLSDQKRR